MPRNYYDVEYDSGPGFGELFGQGLGAGLEAFASHKFDQMRQRSFAKQTQQAYEDLGAPSKVARALSVLSPDQQKMYLGSGATAQWPQLKQQELYEQQQRQYQRQPMRQQSVIGQERLARNLNQQQMTQQQPIESQKLRSRLAQSLNPTGDERQETLLNKLRSPTQQREALRERGLNLQEELPAPQTRRQQEYQPGDMTPIVMAQQQEPRRMPIQQEEQEQPVRRTPQRAPSIDQTAAMLSQAPSQEIVPFVSKEVSAAQRKQDLAEQKLVNEETEPIVKKFNDDYQFAKFSEPRLKKMEQLIEKGKLPGPAFHKFVKSWEDYTSPAYTVGAGVSIGAKFGGLHGAIAGGVGGALVSAVGPVLTQIERNLYPDTEEFEKISNEFLKGAKGVFGGQFTNEEMKAYLAMIPTLMQTDKGKKAVIENMHTFNKAAKLNYKAMRQIIHENGGKRPFDLEEQINARVEPQLERLSDIFREDVAAAIA